MVDLHQVTGHQVLPSALQSRLSMHTDVLRSLGLKTSLCIDNSLLLCDNDGHADPCATTGSLLIPCWWIQGFCGAPSMCCWWPTSPCGWHRLLSWKSRQMKNLSFTKNWTLDLSHIILPSKHPSDKIWEYVHMESVNPFTIITTLQNWIQFQFTQ